MNSGGLSKPQPDDPFFVKFLGFLWEKLGLSHPVLPQYFTHISSCLFSYETTRSREAMPYLVLLCSYVSTHSPGTEEH